MLKHVGIDRLSHTLSRVQNKLLMRFRAVRTLSRAADKLRRGAFALSARRNFTYSEQIAQLYHQQTQIQFTKEPYFSRLIFQTLFSSICVIIQVAKNFTHKHTRLLHHVAHAQPIFRPSHTNIKQPPFFIYTTCTFTDVLHGLL